MRTVTSARFRRLREQQMGHASDGPDRRKPARRRALEDDPLESELRTKFCLTVSEARVALLIVEGLTYAEIADRLGISPHTVHTHVKAVHRKLRVRSNGRAAALIRSLVEGDRR